MTITKKETNDKQISLIKLYQKFISWLIYNLSHKWQKQLTNPIIKQFALKIKKICLRAKKMNETKIHEPESDLYLNMNENITMIIDWVLFTILYHVDNFILSYWFDKMIIIVGMKKMIKMRGWK